jgi:uncharacterized membrane protein YesL
MGKIFDLDSPLVRFLNKVADLLWLNLLTVVCCIPIITAGAAFTALHYCCLKLVRGEEGYITKDFFKSFKLNFKQATIIWLLVFVTGIVLGFDFYIIVNGVVGGTSSVIRVGLLIASILYVFIVLYVFPLQSHFYNPVKTTIKNAFMMSLTTLPKTILMVIFAALPLALTYTGIWFSVGALVGFCILFWFSAPAYFSALLYNKTFKKYEPKEEENDDYTWSVNTDKEESDEADKIEETKSETEEAEDGDISKENVRSGDEHE